MIGPVNVSKKIVTKNAEEAIQKLRKIACRAEQRQNDVYAMEAVRAAANLQYIYNQWYVDDVCEEVLHSIARRMQSPTYRADEADEKTILFYDSFGLDTRGLAIIYLKALADLGYRVVYLTQDSAVGSQPQIHKETKGKDIIFLYLPSHSNSYRKNKKIISIFAQYRPSKAFFYCTPDDVAACVAFDCYAGVVHRYQINLTDHAFWLGKYAWDTCIEFRNYGACISAYHRGVPQEKIHVLPYYPYADLDMPFGGFPSGMEGHPVLFSGGSLYKTMGDDGRYYVMVRKILQQNPELVFLYAGTGDTSGLEVLQRDFPGRCYHIEERQDLFQLMEHVDLYLNTYPVCGGLMSQYAARAGKVPLLLRKTGEDGLEGILLHPETMDIEFESMEDLVAEAHHILCDSDYASETSAKVREKIITEAKFKYALSRLLKQGNTGFAVDMHPVDTSEFRKTYADNLSQYQVDGTLFVPKRSLRLSVHFLGAGLRRWRKKWFKR